MPDKKKEPPFLRTEHNYDTNKASDESGLRCEDDSLTKQSFKEESDINEIVRRFGLTGQLPQNFTPPTYGDFTEVSDFHTAMNAVAYARQQFDMIPAALRARFGNDPGAFVDFCSDPQNAGELEKMGLLKPPNERQDSSGTARSVPKGEGQEKLSPRPDTTSNTSGQAGETPAK